MQLLGKAKSSQTRLIVASAIIWASVIVACAAVLGKHYQEISFILIAGATFHILLLSSGNARKSAGQSAE